MPGNEYHEIKQQLDRIEGYITGGDEPSKGLIVRVDRVEQRQSLGAWFVGTVLGVLILLGLTAAWNFVDRMNKVEATTATKASTGKDR